MLSLSFVLVFVFSKKNSCFSSLAPQKSSNYPATSELTVKSVFNYDRFLAQFLGRLEVTELLLDGERVLLGSGNLAALAGWHQDKQIGGHFLSQDIFSSSITGTDLEIC